MNLIESVLNEYTSNNGIDNFYDLNFEEQQKIKKIVNHRLLALINK